MLETIVCCLLNSIFVNVLNLYGGNESGPGNWAIQELGACDVEYPSDLYLSRQEVNSTADVFDGILNLPDGIDDSFSVTLKYNRLDGGADERATSETYSQFIYRYTKNTDQGQCHEASETYPFYYPIPPDEYQFSDYVYSYKDYQLPTEGIYGTYRVRSYLVQGQNTVGCTQITISFTE
ncbi:uncharacterized protein LOC131845281 [Achroia grisella]|uniref:uncharacterized protein LOC131845281 n=1 Tax=Achroia grisella TaxID=688607 RepID=UPI0027D29CBE|nr:uncharacterized protein LOC131845281 [Achroia grisella]